MQTLTDTRIRAAKPGNKDQWLNDGSGLYLRIRKGGAKTFIIRRKHQGKTEVITLGTYPTLSLKVARLKAAEYRLKQDVSNTTAGELAEQYMAEVVKRTHRRPEQVQGYMDRAIIPELGERKVRDLSRADLVAVVQEYRERGVRGADQLRSILKAMLSYGVEPGYLDSNPMLEVTRRVSGYLPKARERVLTDEEIGFLWNEPHDNARLIRFLLLTGVRIAEAQKGQPWAVDSRDWSIPAAFERQHIDADQTTSAGQWRRIFKL